MAYAAWFVALKLMPDIDERKVQNLSPKTIENYRYVLVTLNKFRPLDRITKKY
jgi:hypothetical protein